MLLKELISMIINISHMFLDNLYQIKTIINQFSKIPKIMRLPETLTNSFLKLEEIKKFY
jgi:hypothetical protein